jgi:hypothetical protein
MKSSKALVAIAILALSTVICCVLYFHHKRALQEQAEKEEQERQATEAYFNADETLYLPVTEPANTNFKAIDDSFRAVCSKSNERVSVKFIDLAFNTQELTHQVDDRITSADVAQAVAHGEVLNREDVDTINRYNRYARGEHTVSDGANISLGVTIAITHRVKRALGSTTPLSVEWLCADPSTSNRIPFYSSDDLPTRSLAQYGIQLTYTNNVYDGNYPLFEAKGLLGTNTFDLKLITGTYYLRLPADPFVQRTDYYQRTAFPSLDSPIEYLQWNNQDIFSLSKLLWHTGDGAPLDSPVLSQPEMQTLATWAQDYHSQEIIAEKGETVEGRGKVWKTGYGSLRIDMLDGRHFELVGSLRLLKPFYLAASLDYNDPQAGEKLNVYSVKGLKIGSETLVVQTLTR